MALYKEFSRLALAAVMTLASAGGALAQQVKLISNDGGIVLSGTITDFDETHYTIDTSMGPVRALIDKVTCEGEACPVIIPPAAEFFVSGAQDMTTRLLPAVLEAHARALGARITPAQNGPDPLYTLTSPAGDDIALVTVLATSSTRGISDLLQGDATIGAAARPAGSREVDIFSASGLGNLRSPEQEHVIALDGLYVITSPQNPVQNVSQREAARIFSGNITNWSELGGPDAAIRLYGPTPQSETGEFFNRVVMRPHGVGFTTTIETPGGPQDIGRAVAADPFGIGFTSAFGVGSAKPLAMRDVCGTIVTPTPFNVKSEDYPLTRRLFAYQTSEEAPVYVSDMLQFAVSDAAQAAVASSGFVDQRILSASIENQGNRLAAGILAYNTTNSLAQLQQMVDEVSTSERLSATFRFETDGQTLDSRARADVQRLAEYLAGLSDANKVVRLIGLTDNVGGTVQNIATAERNAVAVRAAVLAARPELEDTLDIRALGFGGTAPIACNETAEGRWVNRRVEVWISNGRG